MQGGDILELVNPECSIYSGFYSQLSFLVFGVKWEILGLAPNPIIYTIIITIVLYGY